MRARLVDTAFRLRREGRLVRVLLMNRHHRCVRDACGQLSGRAVGWRLPPSCTCQSLIAECSVVLQPAVGSDLFTDNSPETATVRRLSKENRKLRQKLKDFQREAAEEKEEVDSLIEELSKEIIELCAGSLGCVP